MNTVHCHIIQRFKQSGKYMNMNLVQNSMKGSLIMEYKTYNGVKMFVSVLKLQGFFSQFF